MDRFSLLGTPLTGCPAGVGAWPFKFGHGTSLLYQGTKKRQRDIFRHACLGLVEVKRAGSNMKIEPLRIQSTNELRCNFEARSAFGVRTEET